MTIFRRAAAMLAALTLTLTVLLAPGSPAAAAPPASCGNLLLCGYVNTNYQTNQGYELIPSVVGCDSVAFPNNWSSLYNNTGRTVRFWKGPGCTGTYISFSNGQGEVRLATSSHPTWENQIESYRIL